MLNTTDKIIKHKVGLLNLAEELDNISKACQIMGTSRDTSIVTRMLWMRAASRLCSSAPGASPILPTGVDEAIEQAVIKSATDFPAYGQARASNELRKKGIFVSPSGVRSIWLRHDLGNLKQQTNGICERFHKTILQEFYQVTFRKKFYETIEQLQTDLDEWIDFYNNERTHQEKNVADERRMIP